MAAGEGELEELGWAVRTELAKGDVVEAKVFRARQDVRIGLDARDHLAQDDAVREDVRTLVVPLAAQALGRHPIGRAHRRQSVAIPTPTIQYKSSKIRANLFSNW